MADRFALIARKQEIQRKIERTRRQLAQEHEPRSGKPNRRRIATLEDELDRLMAQEYTLRLAIDRSP